MAKENKNQDELNANDLRDGESGNFSGKSVGNENLGKIKIEIVQFLIRHFVFVVFRF